MPGITEGGWSITGIVVELRTDDLLRKRQRAPMVREQKVLTD